MTGEETGDAAQYRVQGLARAQRRGAQDDVGRRSGSGKMFGHSFGGRLASAVKRAVAVDA